MNLGRAREGLVTRPAVARETGRYTSGGSEPAETSATVPAGGFDFPRGGVVKVKPFAGTRAGETSTRTFGLAKAKWKIAGTSCDNAGKVNALIDDDARTLWFTHTEEGRIPPPQWAAGDLGESVSIAAVTVTPRAGGSDHGLVDRYRIELSKDGKTWTPEAEGEFSNIRANPVEQTVKLPAPMSARFVKFTGLRWGARDRFAVAELGVLAAQ